MINSNLPGLQILNQMGQNNRQLARTTQRLSTGLRINSAADDPVGMAMATKMTAEISGMKQAVSNIEMGQDLLKTADGALNEVQSTILRMRELSVYAANDTLTDADREYIQYEIEELTLYINDVVGNSQFNKINLFKEDVLNYFETNAISQISTDLEETQALRDALAAVMEQNMATNELYSAMFDVLEARKAEYVKSGLLSKEEAEAVQFDRESLTLKIFNIDGVDLTSQAKAEESMARINSSLSRVMSYERVGDAEATEVQGLLSRNIVMNQAYRTLFSSFEQYERNRLDIAERDETDDDAGEDAEARAFLEKIAATMPDDSQIVAAQRALFDAASAEEAESSQKDVSGVSRFERGNTFTIQTGPYEGDTYQIDLGRIDSRSLGLDTLDFSTRESAAKSISTMDNALDAVSYQRASIGAQFNALEHRASALDNAILNLESARSRIMDADIAKEMISFTKLNLSNQVNNMLLHKTFDLQKQALGFFG